MGLWEAVRGTTNRCFPILLIILMVMLFWTLIGEHSSSVQLNAGEGLPTEDVFLARREFLEDACLKYSHSVKFTTGDGVRNRNSSEVQRDALLSDYQMAHMLVDVDHGLLYCYVPKVGCTNWKRIMMILTGKSSSPYPLNISAHLVHSYRNYRTLASFSESERLIILKHYKKFMIVRHPLERLLSAYRNKFEGNASTAEWFRQQIGRKIIKAFRPAATQESLEKGHDATFLEFVQYMLDPELSLVSNNNQSWNEHWEPMNGLCNPCTVHYDYIGRFENLVEESDSILKRINPEGNLRYPESKYIKVADTRKEMLKYYEQLPFQLIRRLAQIYAVDMQLFNYSTKGMVHFTLD